MRATLMISVPLSERWSICLLEEFPGGEMPGNIRRAVGVHADDVVGRAAVRDAHPRVLGIYFQVGLVHIEISITDIHNFRIDLETVNFHGWIDRCCLVGAGAGRKSQYRNALHILRFKRMDHKNTGLPEPVPRGRDNSPVLDGKRNGYPWPSFRRRMRNPSTSWTWI